MKKKSKRDRRKNNKKLAKEAKTMNKFESDGNFMDRYLKKSGTEDPSQQAKSLLGKRNPEEEGDEGSSEDSEEEV
jgi:hypothetical protein